MPPIAAADELMGQIRQEILLRNPDLSREGPPPAEEPNAAWQWETPLYFRKGDPWRRLLVSGWSYPEEEYTWSDGLEAIIEIEPPPIHHELLLRLLLIPFCTAGVPSQIIRISDERHLLGVGSAARECELTFLIPQPRVQGRSFRLFLRFPNAISPFQAGNSDDHRKLAIALKSLTGNLL